MNLLEKIYAVFAVFFVFALFTVLLLYPQTRQFDVLLPLGLVGVGINIGLMFIVLRDVLERSFADPSRRYLWIAVIFVFWPAILYYLPKHGFRKRLEQ